jgi:hypothetical protein
VEPSVSGRSVDAELFGGLGDGHARAKSFEKVAEVIGKSVASVGQVKRAFDFLLLRQLIATTPIALLARIEIVKWNGT